VRAAALRRLALAGTLLGLAALLASCPRPASRPSVLLPTLDTTRADHLGAYGYPHARTPQLDQLAAQGIRYQRAYTPAPLTLPAHASLLTGLYPFEHGVRDNGRFRLGEGAETLAEILRREGYRTAAFVSSFVLDARFGLAQGFDRYDDSTEPGSAPGAFGFAERRAPATTDRAITWLEEASATPFFLWVHYFDPHAGYDPHPGDPELEELLPYDAEIGFMDREIGRLLERLRATGRDRETLVVVAADHGEGLWEHGEISHGLFVYESTLRAALLLRLPGGEGAGTRVDAPVSLVDVFPTLLARLGIAHRKVSGEPLPTGEEGEPAAPRPLRPLYFENHAAAYAFGLHPLRGVVRGDDKWIDAPQPERFDLAADPHEVANRHRPGDPLSAQLAAATAQLLEASPRVRPGSETRLELDTQSVARLRDLGYLLSPGPLPAFAPETGPDPKDAAADVREVLAAQSLIGEGRAEEAAERLAAVVDGAAYTNRRALLLLAELATEEPTRERAIAALLPFLERERDLDPELRFAVAAKLGVGLGRSGRYAEALRAYRIAARLAPRDPDVQRGLASARRLLAEQEAPAPPPVD
jgi:arylsulfatase A-like enzyme